MHLTLFILYLVHLIQVILSQIVSLAVALDV